MQIRKKTEEMRLQHITFTGVDAKTDIKALREIQKEYPLAEFGVLTSYHWYENGNRYLDPAIIDTLRTPLKEPNLHLSLHVCGTAAHDAAVGNWKKIDKLVWTNIDIFKRVQLNISNHKNNPEHCYIPWVIGQELIIQQKDTKDLSLFDETVRYWTERPYSHRDEISVLLDASGGRGIDAGIELLQSSRKVGYAGGINPDNVEEKLCFLLERHTSGPFWIDMESGVRTYDWFDLDKVYKVLETCHKVINQFL